MVIRCGIRQISRLHGHTMWHRSQPILDPFSNEHSFSSLHSRCTKFSQPYGCTLPLHLTLLQKVSSPKTLSRHQPEQALQDLKKYLTFHPLLSKTKDGEQLFIYLAVSKGPINAVLIERKKANNSQSTMLANPYSTLRQATLSWKNWHSH